MENLDILVSVQEMLHFLHMSDLEKEIQIRSWFNDFNGDFSDALRRATGLAVTLRKIYVKLHSKNRQSFLLRSYKLKFKRFRDQRWIEFINTRKKI